MRCPRCKEENDQNVICFKCGLKLAITCPRCQKPNYISEEKCSSCNFRLIAFCPQCKAPNNPAAKNCRKCDFELLTTCSKCNTLNAVSNAKCVKCKSEFDKPLKIQQKPAILEEYAVLSVELINLKVIRTKIKRIELVEKLVNNFYQIITKEAKNNSEATVKLSESALAIKFQNFKNPESSAHASVLASQNILNEINELNYKIRNLLKINLKVKIGIAVVNENRKNYFAQVERSIATANNVIISNSLYKLIAGKFDFEKVGPIPINDHMITFYKSTESFVLNVAQSVLTEESPQQVNNEENISEEKVQEDGISNPNNIYLSSQKVYDFVFNTIKNSDNTDSKGHLFAISAPEGAGKTTVTLSLQKNLSNESKLWLAASCQNIDYAIPFSYFQDLFKNLFNLPNLISNVEEARKNVLNFLNNALQGVNIDENQNPEKIINRLIFQNFSENMDIFENQQEIFLGIYNFIHILSSKFQVNILIEDLEYIDSASLECINFLIKQGILAKNINIFATHNNNIHLSDYIYLPAIRDNAINIQIVPLSTPEMNQAINNMLNNQDILPKLIKEKIFQNSRGLPLYIDHAMWYLFNAGLIVNSDNKFFIKEDIVNAQLPETLEDLLKLRIEQFMLNPKIKDVLLSASIFGQKFMPIVVQKMLNIEEKQFFEILQLLINNGLLVNLDQYCLVFKNNSVWKIIYEQCFISEQKSEYHRKALNLLTGNVKINSAILALHAELAGLYQDSINHWNQAIMESIALGSIKPYTNAQLHVINLLKYVELPENIRIEELENNIYEQLGKLNYEVNPDITIKYLSQVILDKEKKGNRVKLIELTGYLAKSCELQGNYSGAVECTDKALSTFTKDEFPLEFALLNYSKLESIIKLGCLEQAVMLIKKDIFPILAQINPSHHSLSALGSDDLNYVIIDTEFLLTKALALQGNKEALNQANGLIIKAARGGFFEIELQTRLLIALFKVFQGESNTVKAVLEHVKGVISSSNVSDELGLYYLFVNLLSNLSFDKANNQEISKAIYFILSLAESVKNYNIQVILKLLIGQLYKKSSNYEQARLIYNETIKYCSEYKLANEALLAWYLIADLEMAQSNYDTAETIAQKALEIASKAHINNYLFVIQLQKLISEIYIFKGDYELARINATQALNLAEKMDIYSLKSQLNIILGKIYQEIATESPENRQENVNNSHSYYITALNTAQDLENETLINKVEKELINLNNYCQHARIIL